MPSVQPAPAKRDLRSPAEISAAAEAREARKTPLRRVVEDVFERIGEATIGRLINAFTFIK